MKKELQQLFNQYIDYCVNVQGLRPQTIRGYKEVASLFFAQMPEVKYPEDLNDDTITTFFRRIKNRERLVGRAYVRRDLKASTIRTYGSKLHAFFEWLLLRGDLMKNPITKRSLPTPDYSDKRALNRQSIERIITSIIQHSRNSFILKRDLALVQVLLFCGVRRNELLSIKVLDVDFQKATLRVNGNTSKSKKTRVVPLNATVLLHIEDYLAERRRKNYKCEYLFTSSSQDTQLTEHGLKHMVDRLIEQSGVKFHIHQFRHSYASALARANTSSFKIQKLLGHSDLRMTERYLRSTDINDMKQDVEKLSLDSF